MILPHLRPRELALALTLAGLAASVQVQAALTNRWSFNNSAGAAPAGSLITDSVGSAPAVVRGVGATFTGTALTLPGTTTGNQTPSAISAYVDLPNGLISSKIHLTFEFWVTPRSHQSFQRLIDLGRVIQTGDGLGAAGEITGLSTTAPGTTQASDALTLTLSRSALGQQRFEGKLNGTTNTADTAGLFRQVDTDIATTAGTQYHYVVTFESGAGAFATTGGRLSWFRNGVLAATTDVGFRLSQIEDVNNWLGRSLWSADRMTHATYNEVRLWDHAFSAAEVAASFASGADPGDVPVAAADTLTIHRGQKASIAVLANDTGNPLGGTVEIVQPPVAGSGSAVARPDGRIIYTPAPGATAEASFTYRAANASGLSAPATVTVVATDSLRIASPGLAVPSAPPATALTLVNAFGTLSFNQPVAIVTAPGDSRRVFICQKGGLLQLVPDATATTPAQSTFLNLPALLTTRGESISTNSEQGLLGLAFHPSYASNRYFYLFYSVTKTDGLVYERVSRFTTQATNPDAADTTSELVLIEQRDEAANHNGGGLAFGPDGYLYISLGDEGNQNDSLNNSQTITKDFFAALARIDVDKKPGSLAPNTHAAVPRDAGVARYAIPPDNPYVGATSFNGIAVSPTAVRTEFYAVGFRNPWRFSFDTTTGELWVADVGQDAWEEIDVVVKGGNYGWAYREGARARSGAGTPPAGFTPIDPLYEYAHGSGTFQGNSITGGFVYRGARIASLTGAYIFADYVSGHIWSLRRNAPGTPPTVERIAGEGGLVAFGADPSNGDILIADIDGSRILRLIASDVGGTTFPQTLSATGLFADVADLSPNPGLLAYAPNLPFWSDHAVKRRWFSVPDTTTRITWSRDAPWIFPAGTVWVKHFDLETTRGDSATRRRLETRLLVKTATGAYGVSYRWNDAQTDATLVPEDGVSFGVNITENGIARVQTWQIPSRASCLTCHTPQAGHALSFNTRQLNLSGSLAGTAGNQIDLLRIAGYLDNLPPSSHTLPRHLRPDETTFPLEARARSYLAVNCAYCHQTGGTATPAAWDGRPSLPLAATGLLDGAAANNGGDPANRLIVPGDPIHSIVLNRTAAANGFTRMPPLASTEIDATGVQLLTDWILALAAREDYPAWRLARFGSATSPAGAPDADPDADGRPNDAEFNAGTAPLDGGAFLQPAISTFAGPGSSTVTLSFTLPANRSWQIETSADLTTWTAWDVPGNQTLPTAGGSITLTGPAPTGAGEDRRFYRVRVWEN